VPVFFWHAIVNVVGCEARPTTIGATDNYRTSAMLVGISGNLGVLTGNTTMCHPYRVSSPAWHRPPQVVVVTLRCAGEVDRSQFDQSPTCASFQPTNLRVTGDRQLTNGRIRNKHVVRSICGHGPNDAPASGYHFQKEGEFAVSVLYKL